MCAWEVVLNSQERALEIYLSSISLATNLKPVSFTKLSDELAREGIEVSKSTLQRWSSSGDWAKKAEEVARKISSSTTNTGVASREVQKAIKNLEVATDVGSTILLEFLKQTLAKHDRTLDEIELVLKITTASAALRGNTTIQMEDKKITARELCLTSIKDDDVIECEVDNENQVD